MATLIKDPLLLALLPYLTVKQMVLVSPVPVIVSVESSMVLLLLTQPLLNLSVIHKLTFASVIAPVTLTALIPVFLTVPLTRDVVWSVRLILIALTLPPATVVLPGEDRMLLVQFVNSVPICVSPLPLVGPLAVLLTLIVPLQERRLVPLHKVLVCLVCSTFTARHQPLLVTLDDKFV